MSELDLRTLPEPGNKYKVGLKIGEGVGGEVHEAVEKETGKKVAIKIIELKKETEDEIRREFQVLKQMSAKENFVEFYGIFSKKGKDNVQKIWLVIEFCEGRDAAALVRKLEQENKKLSELHIAYIMRETIKAVIHLHESDITHRDIRGSNILFTADGRVKLVDYGISKQVERNKKMKTCVGSPSWLAPEVILCQTEQEPSGYDKKADVWAVGITAIELGDGQAPFEDTHPGRALFQIVKNPPPTLRKPSDWSQLYNDFIVECLVKNPENRPFLQELIVHPFFEPLDKEENLIEDLRALLEKYKNTNLFEKTDVQVRKGFLKTENRSTPEKMLQEDLAVATKVTEDSVLFELHERIKKNEFHTFIGDILLVLNTNKISDVYGLPYHKKYRFKAKSQNAPHIYSIADSAYREVFHHEKPQHVLFAGETGAGKTVNMMHATDHLLFLGQGFNSSKKVTTALRVIQAMGNAATPHNSDSTRHVLQMKITFTDTGKVSGAVFRVYLLEKERVTMLAKKQRNFHIFYYFYDAMQFENKLPEFYLGEEEYKLLKTEMTKEKNFEDNVGKFQQFENNLTDLGFENEQILAIKKILTAVVLLGEIEFLDDEDGNGVLVTPEAVENAADLLGVDKKKLSWALLNYCLIVNGEAIMRHNTKQEAEEAKNILTRGLYSRLVDWVVNTINEKLSVCRVIYGDRHVISLLDLFGFECYKRNTLNQLFVNILNEQFQFHYNQKIFAWDKQTAAEEEIPFPNLEFKDNRAVIDLIMSKPDGLLYKLDEATRSEDSSTLLENLGTGKETPIFVETSKEFFINHYTGKLAYDSTEMAEKNRDFLPPEIIDTMRLSTQEVTKQLFSKLLSKSGNLSKQERRRSTDEVSESKKNKKNVNTAPSGRFSQSRQMRTLSTTFRGACVDLFKSLTVREYGFHFVRCIRTDLSGKPGAFDPEVVRQQLRALAVVDTVVTIQQGYTYSVSHEEFIRRYRFLAFDFDETVEETKDNCRLLLLRLKLEGWTMGKTKVFLKYFNKEYLSRLYETQIKKIVKVQSMMRAFMARRKLYKKIKRYQVDADKNKFIVEGNREEMEAKAARIIQKRFREHTSSKCNLTERQIEFIRPWYKRWRTKSIFQVLLLYRAERLQTLVNFCLQIHLYNQNCLDAIQKTTGEIDIEDVNSKAKAKTPKPSIPKLQFLWTSLNLRGDVSNCESLPDCNIEELEAEVSAGLSEQLKIPDSAAVDKKMENVQPKNYKDKEIQTSLPEENSDCRKLEELMADSRTPTQQEDEEEQKSTSDPIITTKQKEKEEKAARDSPTTREEIEKETAKLFLESIQSEKNETPIQELIEKVIEVQKQSNDSNPTAENGKNKTAAFEIRSDAATVYNHPPPVKLRKNSIAKLQPGRQFQTSISELETKFKNKDYSENSDEPPFNFKALLKKTNYPTAPRKSSQVELTFQQEIASFSFRKKSLSCTRQNRRESEMTVAELVPGILVYGKVTDL